MQIIRTLIWVLILIGVVVFSLFNWREVEVTIWDNLVLETKVPALVIISFLLGFLPVWLYSRGVIWSLNRKIRSLEIAAKTSSVSTAASENERGRAKRREAPVPDAQPERAPTEPATAGPVAAEDTRLNADNTTATDRPETATRQTADTPFKDDRSISS